MSDYNNPAAFRPQVTLKSLADIKWEIPTFMWELDYEGQTTGILPVGAMSMFAGRPTAGKSSSARSIAAQVTPVSYTHLTLPTICSV